MEDDPPALSRILSSMKIRTETELLAVKEAVHQEMQAREETVDRTQDYEFTA